MITKVDHFFKRKKKSTENREIIMGSKKTINVQIPYLHFLINTQVP